MGGKDRPNYCMYTGNAPCSFTNEMQFSVKIHKLFLTSHTKNNSKQITNLNVKVKTIKCLEIGNFNKVGVAKITFTECKRQILEKN